MAIGVFLFFVGFVLALSFYLGRKKQSASGYFAAHGQIGWFVNGVAFAGDYLSAASFLGICGMLAFYGYDGFLYSIGFLAGWVVALFVIAEPIKRLGKYTFADALDAKFNSKGIKLAAAFSTLVVSIFYLIPQMVGAGALVQPLLGIAHHWGVIIVGSVVIVIVVTAGMVSTTWVQFIKGSLLVAFCAALVVAILARGVHVNVEPTAVRDAKGNFLSNTAPKSARQVASLGDFKRETDAVGPIDFVAAVSEAEIVSWKKDDASGKWVGTVKKGSELLVPGGYFSGIRSPNLTDRLDFVSLMLALFCGTASLPHILIRYYTVKDAAAARKSTVVGIASIGFFYMLTLFIGLGAMISGNMLIDPVTLKPDSNMAAPLLAKTFGDLPFAIISGIAFTTVLGTVSGLIMASSGAIAHDLIESVMGHKLADHVKVGAAKWAAIGVGVIAIVLGILFKGLNVGFLVGWAFNVAASANLPAIVMLLFWRHTTRKGMIAAIVIGTVSSLVWLMLTKEAFQLVYYIKDHPGYMPFSQPGLVTIPLGFIVLIVVSLLTENKREPVSAAA
jgi:cation/acetate symporter